MQAKKSTLSENKAAYFIYLLRKNIPYMLMYSGLLLISLASKFLEATNYPKYINYSTSFYRYTTLGMLFSFCLLIVAPFLAAILNFRFLTSRQANDLMFSLPIGKANLFISNYCAGAVSYLIPYIIFGNPLWTFLSYQNFTQQETQLNLMKIVKTSTISFGISIILFLACFSFAVFLCINIGKIFDACLYYGLLSVFSPVAFSLIINIFNSNLFGIVNTGNGYSTSVTIPEIISSVICRIFSINTNTYNYTSSVASRQFNMQNLVSVITYSVFAVIFILLSYFLFKKRPREKTDTPFAFNYMKIVLAILISFFMGLVFSLIFSTGSITRDNIAAAFVPFIIVSAISYLGVFAISNRTLNVLCKSLTFYGITIVLYLGIFSYFFTGGFGAVTYIPKVSDIAEVSINLDSNRYIDDSVKTKQVSLLNVEGIKNVYNDKQIVIFSNPKKIFTVAKFHNEILKYYEKYDFDYNKINEAKNQENANYYNENTYTPKITYKLKNGKEIVRQYNTIDSSLLSTQYYNISTESDYNFNSIKEMTSEEFSNYLNNFSFDNITICSEDIIPYFITNGISRNLIDLSSNDTKMLLDAIFEDEKGFKSFDDYAGERYITVSIMGDTSSLSNILPDCLNFSINENYKCTISALKRLGVSNPERSIYPDKNIKMEIYRDLPTDFDSDTTKIAKFGNKKYFISQANKDTYDYQLQNYEVNTISIFKDYELAENILNDLYVKHEFEEDGIIVRFKIENDNYMTYYSRSYYLAKGTDGYNSAVRFMRGDSQY